VAVGSLPKELTRGYSNYVLDSRTPKVLSIQELDDMDAIEPVKLEDGQAS
jgi:hypothetical protein